MAKDGVELSKRILIFLIDQSEGLIKDVCLTLVADHNGYTAEEILKAAYGMGAMQGANGTTHLLELFCLMGEEIPKSSFHYGDYDPSRKGDPFNSAGMFAGMPVDMVGGRDPAELVRTDMPRRYTFWLARKNYSGQATLVVATREVLE